MLKIMTFDKTILENNLGRCYVRDVGQYSQALDLLNYGKILSESLKDLVLSQTRLDLDKSSGDLRFEGYISDYLVSTAAAQGDETAALNRLSITVNVTYYNSFNEEDNFTSSFTRFADFDSNLNFDQVEDQLIDEINEQLIQDIFDRSFGNW